MTVSINLQHSLSDLALDSQRFTSKDDIKPWLQNYLLHKKGIHVVIARSDANKIVFRCKSDKSKETAEKLSIGSRRQISCPFKIRANYSIRNHVWTLVVMNENHDHELDNFGLIQQSKLAYLFNHHKTDESGLLSLGSDDSTAAALTNSSKSNTSSDVFSSFIPSSTEMVSPNEVHDNHNLALSIDELKDTVTSKDNSDSEKMLDTFEEQKSKKRKVPRGHNVKRRKTKIDTISVHDEGQEPRQDKSSKEVVGDLRDQVNVLISNTIINNQNFTDKEKSIMIKSFFSRFISDYKGIINTVANQQKMALNSWFNTPNPAQTNLHSHANTNLIPLSPLLNDTDTEYTSATPNNSNNQSIDNLTHLPNMSLGSSLITNIGATSNTTGPSNSNANNNYNNFIVPPQMQLLQIQNQNQQLPSFNTIQNQLPLSPNSLANNSTASLFVNNFNTNLNSNTSSLIPPINNSNSNTNTTLNPSHLLKSSNKNNVFNHNVNLTASSNLLSRNEYKQNNSLNPINNNIALSNTISLNTNQNSGSISNTNTLNSSIVNYGGLSSPNNNIINPNIQNNSTNGAFYNKEILSGNTSNNPQNSTTSNTSGALNHIASLNDNGW